MKKAFLVLITFINFAFIAQAQTTLNRSLTHDGINREYLVYVPASYTGQEAVPLVFNLHGYGGTNSVQLTYGDFRPVADTANFIIVLPQGTEDNTNTTFWNANYGAAVDDIGFISELLDTMMGNYNINSNKVYSTGMSNGGFMSFTLACALSNRITAVASVTGSMVITQPNNCTFQKPIPSLQIHGTADATVPYNGNAGIMSIASVLDYLVEKNDCDTTALVVDVVDNNTSDGCTAERYDYLNGQDGSEVVHYKITNGGHTWPGAINVPALGNTNQDFDASAEIWKFFNKYGNTTSTSVLATDNTIEEALLTSNLVQSKLKFNAPLTKKGELYNINGQLVLSVLVGESEILLPHLMSGLYLLKVGDRVEKVVIENQ